jgi:phosphatidylglycerophosphate synthase
MHALAGACVRAGITPNAISIAGMVAAIAAGTLLAGAHRWWGDSLGGRAALALAAGLIQFRLLCNLIDGLVAVEGRRQTAMGELYNEIPDRISDVAVLAGAGYAAGSSPAMGWLAATLAVFVAYLRAVGKGCGLPSDYRGPMAKQQRMATMTVACLYLALTPASWRPAIPDFFDASRPGVIAIALAIIALGCVVTAARRLRAIASGLRGRAKPGQS